MSYHFDDNLYNGNYYTGKIAQIYYDGLLVPTNKQTYLHIDQLLHKINFFVHIMHVLAVKQVGIWVWYNSGQKNSYHAFSLWCTTWRRVNEYYEISLCEIHDTFDNYAYLKVHEIHLHFLLTLFTFIFPLYVYVCMLWAWQVKWIHNWYVDILYSLVILMLPFIDIRLQMQFPILRNALVFVKMFKFIHWLKKNLITLFVRCFHIHRNTDDCSAVMVPLLTLCRYHSLALSHE